MPVTITKPVRRRAHFHKLAVAGVDELTDDAVVVTFEVPSELRETFTFRPGQHLTLRRSGKEDVRRSYSICSTPFDLDAGRLRIGVRLVPGGAFSTYLHDELSPGDLIEVMPPLGHFTTGFDPGRSRHYAAIVAGSGITPVLSLVATALQTEPASRFTVLYGNRYTRSVMFVEELADLKDRYPDRLHLAHVLSREPQESELFSGRLDPPRLERILDVVLPVSRVDEWFLCGPQGMVDGARDVLAERGVTAERVHAELFFAEGEEADRRTARPAPEPDETGSAHVTMVLDGRSSSFSMRRAERVLDAARRVRGEVPFACTGGVCGTCRAKLVDGEVKMARNYALEPDRRRQHPVVRDECRQPPAGGERGVAQAARRRAGPGDPVLADTARFCPYRHTPAGVPQPTSSRNCAVRRGTADSASAPPGTRRDRRLLAGVSRRRHSCRATADLVPDAHLVALMRQHGVREIWTNDRDYRKFDGIVVRDPFAL